MKKIIIYLFLLIQFVGVAQTSSPISTGKIAVSTSGKYASLFRYKIKRKNGDTLSNYAWVNTNTNGVITDSRAKRLNGYFASGSMAVTNIPSTYSFTSTGVVDDFQSQKYIGYMVNYPFIDIVKTKLSFDEFIQAGATEAVIPIRWADVFHTYAQQQANSPSSWTKYDDLINYVKNKGVKVSLRICVDLDDSTNNDLYGGLGDFYKLSNSARDEWGNVARIGGGSGHSSLAYATGRNMMLDFAQKAVNRYNSILGNQFLWYSVVMTAQEETGYNFENATYVNDNRTSAYPALFDYSSHAITGFREWLTTKYGTPTALNAAWGSSYSNISDATPPTTGKQFDIRNPADRTPSNIYANYFDLNALFATNRGRDFWEYNYTLIKNFASSAKALSAGMNVKFYAEFGSVSDFASNIRMSSNIRDFATITDGMKAQFGAYPSQDNLAISLDMFRSNYNKKISTEAHIIDFNGAFSVFGNTTVPVFKDIASYWLKKGVESQLKEIIFIADRSDFTYYTALKEVAIELKNYLFSYNQPTATAATVNYTQGEMLNNYYTVFNRWAAAGGATNNRINLVQSTDINGSGGGTGGGGGSNGTTLSIFDIAYYNVKQADTKSSNLQSTYDNDRVMFQAATHIITYTSGDKAKGSYIIKGVTDGEEWLKMTQTAGVTNTENNKAYANSHPDRRYKNDDGSDYVGEDCVFYLPIQDYQITMSNTGTTSFTFSVINPHQYPSNPYKFDDFEMSLAPGQSFTYTVYASTMRLQTWQERAIKIICNKIN